MPNLAVLIDKARTDEALEELKAAGVYDDARRILPHDDATLELPVTAVPRGWNGEVIEQPAPEPRTRGLDDLLRQRGWTDEELERAPNSWSVVGDVVLVRLADDCPRPAEIGEALIELQNADTVLAREGIEGPHREPSIDVVAGSGDTETIHTEHGTRYALDLSEVMFSPGNMAERVRMGEVVEADERVLDMFAGIGYFTLPMARSGASVTAVERNPTAFGYLLENAVLNEVEDRIRPIRADCQDLGDWHNAGLIDGSANRIVMGFYDAHEYLETALALIEPDGLLHFHEATPENLVWERPVSRVEEAAESSGRSVEIVERRRVKTHAPGVHHVVLDVRIS